MRIHRGTLKRCANESAAHSPAYLAAHAAFSAALGADSSTSAVPDNTTLSPPRPSPPKFNVTFGLLAMLRTRAPGWLYTDTF